MWDCGISHYHLFVTLGLCLLNEATTSSHCTFPAVLDDCSIPFCMPKPAPSKVVSGILGELMIAFGSFPCWLVFGISSYASKSAGANSIYGKFVGSTEKIPQLLKADIILSGFIDSFQTTRTEQFRELFLEKSTDFFSHLTLTIYNKLIFSRHVLTGPKAHLSVKWLGSIINIMLCLIAILIIRTLI